MSGRKVLRQKSWRPLGDEKRSGLDPGHAWGVYLPGRFETVHCNQCWRTPPPSMYFRFLELMRAFTRMAVVRLAPSSLSSVNGPHISGLPEHARSLKALWSHGAVCQNQQLQDGAAVISTRTSSAQEVKGQRASLEFRKEGFVL